MMIGWLSLRWFLPEHTRGRSFWLNILCSTEHLRSTFQFRRVITKPFIELVSNNFFRQLAFTPKIDLIPSTYFPLTVDAAIFSWSNNSGVRSKCKTWATTCVHPCTKYNHPSSTLTLRLSAC